MDFVGEDVIENLGVHTGDDAKSGHEAHASQHVPLGIVRLGIGLTGEKDLMGDLDADTEERTDGRHDQERFDDGLMLQGRAGDDHTLADESVEERDPRDGKRPYHIECKGPRHVFR